MMKRSLTDNLVKDSWVLISCFSIAMSTIGSYLYSLATFHSSRIYQEIFILLFGLGEIVLFSFIGILLIRKGVIVLQRPT